MAEQSVAAGAGNAGSAGGGGADEGGGGEADGRDKQPLGTSGDAQVEKGLLLYFFVALGGVYESAGVRSFLESVFLVAVFLFFFAYVFVGSFWQGRGDTACCPVR